MKRRYKILVFVLLLCTMFSTLLFVRPRVNAQVIDLTDTTWLFNTFIDVSTEFDYDIMFSSWHDTYYSITCSYNTSPITATLTYVSPFVASTVNVYNVGDDLAWQSDEYRTINILSGDDVTNLGLIDYLNTNATLVENPPSGGDTENISGGYRFNSSISTSIFGDIEEQELDILFENNFFLYNNTEVAYDMFTLHADDLGNNYFCFENSTSGDYIRVGIVSLDNTYISMFSQYRTLMWTNQEVSDDTYIWLNENGVFGEFDVPTEPAPDDMFGWLLDSVNAFLQIEILPGVRIIWLIQFALVVPIALIILKLYFGG